MKPMSDLCWMCQQNSSAILRATNKPESVKTATIEEARSTSFLYNWSDHITRRSVILVAYKSLLISSQLTMYSSLLLHLIVRFHITPMIFLPTIRLTTHSRCISQQIPYNLVLYFFSLRGNVAFSVYTARLFLIK